MVWIILSNWSVFVEPGGKTGLKIMLRIVKKLAFSSKNCSQLLENYATTAPSIPPSRRFLNIQVQLIILFESDLCNYFIWQKRKSLSDILNTHFSRIMITSASVLLLPLLMQVIHFWFMWNTMQWYSQRIYLWEYMCRNIMYYISINALVGHWHWTKMPLKKAIN